MNSVTELLQNAVLMTHVIKLFWLANIKDASSIGITFDQKGMYPCSPEPREKELLKPPARIVEQHLMCASLRPDGICGGSSPGSLSASTSPPLCQSVGTLFPRPLGRWGTQEDRITTLCGCFCMRREPVLGTRRRDSVASGHRDKSKGERNLEWQVGLNVNIKDLGCSLGGMGTIDF